jgi:hypothetical protein
VWYGMMWYGMAWFGMAWCGIAWHGVVLHGNVWHHFRFWGHFACLDFANLKCYIMWSF